MEEQCRTPGTGRKAAGVRGTSIDQVIALLTAVVVGLSLILLVVAIGYAAADRLIEDRLLAVVGVLELGLLAQLVGGLIGVGDIPSGAERATFVAYLVTVPLIPPGTAFLAIKEKTRWSMGSVAVGAGAVAVMTIRLQQVWDLGV
jgi:hypothetical protein